MKKNQKSMTLGNLLMKRTLSLAIAIALLIGAVSSVILYKVSVSDMESKVVLQNDAYARLIESTLADYKISGLRFEPSMRWPCMPLRLD